MNKLKALIVVIAVLIFSEGAGLIYFAYKSNQFYKKSQDLSKKLESLEGLKPNYERLTQEEQRLKNEYANLLRENEAMKEDRNNLLTQAKKLLADSARAKELATSLEKIQEDIKSLQNKKDALDSQNQRLNEQLQQVTKAREQLTEERDKFKLAYEKARKDTIVRDLKREISNLQSEKNELSSVFNRTQKEKEQLADKRDDLEKEKYDLTNALTKYKNMYTDAFRKNKELEVEVKSLPKKFSEIARQNKVLIKETSQMHYNLGVFYTKNKEYSRAASEFEKVVEITPDDSYAHFNLGYIYAEYLVNRRKAIEHFRHFLRLAKSDDPDTDWVRKYLLTWETYEGKEPMK